MSARSLAFLGLGLGIYLLGVATSLLLVQFNEYPDAWRRNLPVFVLVLSLLVIVSSVAWLVKESAETATHAGSIHAQQSGSTFAAASPAAHRELTADTDPLTREPRIQRADYTTKLEEGVRRGPAHDSASAESEREPSSSKQRSSSAPPQSADMNRGLADPPKAVEPQPADLIEAWEVYRREGDGHFNVDGLQSQLDARHFTASVRACEQVGARDCVLVVETPARRPDFYVVPSFTKSPRKVSKWFHDHSGGALNGRVQKLLELAEGRWTESGIGNAIKKGVVA